MAGKKRRRVRVTTHSSAKSSHAIAKSRPSSLLDQLQAAERLADQGNWIEARELLEEVNDKWPGQVEVLMLLLGVCVELRDMDRYEALAEEMVRRFPEE